MPRGRWQERRSGIGNEEGGLVRQTFVPGAAQLLPPKSAHPRMKFPLIFQENHCGEAPVESEFQPRSVGLGN